MTPVLAHALLARGYLPGRRCLVYGAGRYVAATAQRLAQAGAEVTVVPPPGLTGPDTDAGIAVEEPAELAYVGGYPRLDRVGLRRGGQVYEREVDTLLYAAGMLANTHWLAGSGLELGERGAIVVDGRYQTSIPGIFAVGTAVAPDLDHASSIAMGAEVAAILAGGQG
jgi:thioredoxin reductase